jgi:heme A synthase
VSSQPRLRRTLGRVGIAAAIATFALIVLGGVVRITGSGMGCGDDWPLCNGHLIPPMDLPTLIEYSHRLAALLVSAFVVAVLVLAVAVGRREGSGEARSGTSGGGPRLVRLGVLGVVLLVVQILLGAVTVWLELPPTTVILHLGTAMLLLATLVVGASEVYAPGRRALDDRTASLTLWTAVAALVVVVLGGLTANLHAGFACQGFPLCNGSLIPAGGPLVHTHWTHRLAAYALAAWCFVLPMFLHRGRANAYAVRRTSTLAAAVVLVQLIVGAAMVLTNLDSSLRAAHVGLGAAVFVTLVRLAWVARYAVPDTDQSGRPVSLNEMGSTGPGWPEFN